jgi:hypothetical protein
MKKKTDLTLQDAMKGMFDELKMTAKLQEVQLSAVWTRLMGPEVATYTSAIRIKDGDLILTIVSAPLKRDLTFRKEEIRTGVNALLGSEVVLRVLIR